jgi:hypothetical protein
MIHQLPPNIRRVIYLFDVREIHTAVLSACEAFRGASMDRDCPKSEVLTFLWFVHHLREGGHMVVEDHSSYYELWNYGLHGNTALDYVNLILHGLSGTLVQELLRKVLIAQDHFQTKALMRLTPRVLELTIDLSY